MNLELSAEQVAALARAPHSYLSDLGLEIADTDREAMRGGLEHEMELLAAVVHRPGRAGS